MNSQHQTAYGVFKPVGHVVMSFAVERDAQEARGALLKQGVPRDDIVHYSPDEMKQQADADIESATFLSTVGQELNLVRAHRALAEQGSSFLVVRAPDDETIDRVAGIARRFHAQRAQRYGRFIVEELVPVGSTAQQVFESPDRGLDAQTPSGLEGDVHRPRRR
ncbi:MAG TPA: hypothetical protein VIO33_09560 [Burkholderiaceae bacterium]